MKIANGEQRSRWAPLDGPRLAGAALAILVLAIPGRTTGAQSIADRHRSVAQRIIARAVSDSFAWHRLAELTETFGHRLSGSASLERAIDWILEEMRRDGLENVRGEPVLVPHWVRGEESLELVQPRRELLPMLGLGGSVGTPADGIEAELVAVRSFQELMERSAEARGRIVLFNVPFTTYGETVRYRTTGAVAAAKAGAVAALLRSVTPYSMRTPHTGATSYESGVQPIPFAAVAPEDADMLERMIARGSRPVVRLKMGARTLPDAQSRNVVAELVGREHPEEVVVLGGHIDSWDVGRGAMDDAGGVVAAWEAVRILKELGLRPRRTLRIVGWTNEENGLRGGNAYPDKYRDQLGQHVLAIESDAGVFKPIGFGFTGSDSAFQFVQQIGHLLEPIGASTITRGGGGADIAPIMAHGVPGMGLNVDGSRYFWYHHSHADTVDKLDPADLALCVAALAVVAYVAAEEGVPR